MLSHPLYKTESNDYRKWRLTYEGGTSFKNEYLRKFSDHESDTDFNTRSLMSYVPAFATAAINEVIGAICSRIKDVVRVDSSKKYTQFVQNVDGNFTSMDSFISTKVLKELVTMRKVGICIERESLEQNASVAKASQSLPYLYIYTAENILSWKFNKKGVLVDVLLRHCTYKQNQFGLPEDDMTEFKRYHIGKSGFVIVEYYKDEDYKIRLRTINTNLSVIPLVLLELPRSLMTDIADHQIALLNIESSDIAYIQRSNIPFYVEQYDPAAKNTFVGDSAENTDGEKEVVVGTIKGRRYPKGLEAPAYIHPSSEPIKASMDKQAKIKEDIRLLLNLTIANLRPSKNTSAESKDFDQGALENGLSLIGSVLESGERAVAFLFGEYTASVPATIRYPSNYTLKTDFDRREEAEKLIEISKDVWSLLYKKEILKKIVSLTLAYSISEAKLNDIYAEIDEAETLNTVENIQKDVELGLVSREYASQLLSYPEGEAEKANTEHAERLAIISKYQSQAPTQDQAVDGQNKEAKESDGKSD